MRGRQAEAARNDHRLLEAAHEVFTTQGFDAPVSAIAKRAGIGMGSLYRRYRTKEELLQRLCVIAMERAEDAARSAMLIEDPWEGLTHYIAQCVGFRSGALAPVAGTIRTTDEMMQVSARAGQVIDAVVCRAHDSAVLRADATALDIARLIEQFGRPAPAPPTAEDDNAQRRLLAIALDGLRAPGAAPLPGHPPSREQYEARWQA